MSSTTLDWSDSLHWSGGPGPCRICSTSTLLLDDAGAPAHKVCVERLLDQLPKEAIR